MLTWCNHDLQEAAVVRNHEGIQVRKSKRNGSHAQTNMETGGVALAGTSELLNDLTQFKFQCKVDFGKFSDAILVFAVSTLRLCSACGGVRS